MCLKIVVEVDFFMKISFCDNLVFIENKIFFLLILVLVFVKGDNNGDEGVVFSIKCECFLLSSLDIM